MDASKQGKRLVTSAEVLQELLHVYLPVKRFDTLDAALSLLAEGVETVTLLQRRVGPMDG